MNECNIESKHLHIDLVKKKSKLLVKYN